MMLKAIHDPRKVIIFTGMYRFIYLIPEVDLGLLQHQRWSAL